MATTTKCEIRAIREVRLSLFTPSLFPDDLDHVLAHTRDNWEELRGQRLFMTGGTGFFGIWLIESFLWANEKLGLGAEIHVLSRDPAAFLRKMPHLEGQPGLRFQAGNMARFDIPAGQFRHVIHAATESYDTSAAADLVAAFNRDLNGTGRVLDLVRQCGAMRVLFTSSGAVYGPQPPELMHIPEDYPSCLTSADGKCDYRVAKRYGELLWTHYAETYGFDTTIARGFAFVGPYLPLDRNFAVGNFLRDALAGGPVVIQGDGTPYRSYLYAADLAVWLWTILLRGRSCRPYNVGSDQAVTIAALARMVLDAVAPSAELQVLGVADPNCPAQRYVPDTKRAQDELGLRVRIGLPEGIARTAAWHATRGTGCPGPCPTVKPS